MTNSSPVSVLASYGREESSESRRPFRNFVAKVRLYQNEIERTHDGAGTGSTGNSHDDAKPPMNGPLEDRKSDAEWSDPEGVRQSEDNSSRSESDSEYAGPRGASSNDQKRRRSRSDLIIFIPKAVTTAKALSFLGIAFTEQANDFAVAGGLDRSQLFDVMQMTRKLHNLEGLRKITCEYLLRTPTSDLESPHLESDAPKQTDAETGGRPSSTHSRATVNMFDENIMYKTCPGMARAVFHDKLKRWMAAPLPDTSAHPDRVVSIPSRDSNPWGLRYLLGWSPRQHMNVATGQIMDVDTSRFALFQNLLDGLWLALNTSRLSKPLSELKAAEEKLPSAILALVTTIHESMERAEELPYRVFYYSVSESFARLFGVMNVLEMHALTIETVHETGKSTSSRAKYPVALRHMTIALLLAAKTLTELEDQTDVLEAEELRRKEALAKVSSTVDSSADYGHVEECFSKIFGVRMEARRRKRFQENVNHLESLGWNRHAARTILLHECRRRRITHHADLAARMLEDSFLKALTPDPSRKIRWKAAALPTDLVALLITQVLERPVLDGQDALNMYMRYITDLVRLIPTEA